jgi:hypothetical protein
MLAAPAGFLAGALGGGWLTIQGGWRAAHRQAAILSPRSMASFRDMAGRFASVY